MMAAASDLPLLPHCPTLMRPLLPLFHPSTLPPDTVLSVLTTEDTQVDPLLWIALQIKTMVLF